MNEQPARTAAVKNHRRTGSRTGSIFLDLEKVTPAASRLGIPCPVCVAMRDAGLGWAATGAAQRRNTTQRPAAPACAA